jgi:carboxyl-terminal processing protease
VTIKREGRLVRQKLPVQKIGNKINIKLLEKKIFKNHIAYLRINSWTNPNFLKRKLYEFIKNLIKLRSKILIIDVRGNGGGDSRIAKHFAGYFFNRKVLFSQTKTRISGSKSKFNTKYSYVLPHQPHLSIPIILLIDGACLSSNEYFIAGMKDNKRAYLIGQKTGGSSGNPKKFKITYQKKIFELFVSTWVYLRPNGQELEGRGIVPHLAVKYQLDDFITHKDVVLERALSISKSSKNSLNSKSNI